MQTLRSPLDGRQTYAIFNELSGSLFCVQDATPAKLGAALKVIAEIAGVSPTVLIQ